eukprot:TRINITY_DN4_c0_g3_i1.p2 TRINITY_DN4_c0_g3~~TRINITY_DN4_c0_g3_i1.p2  ORF type:complete len:84 (-),score=34.93 TRINITY_DN4_c0_g3_i1:3-254(-)
MLPTQLHLSPLIPPQPHTLKHQKLTLLQQKILFLQWMEHRFLRDNLKLNFPVLTIPNDLKATIKKKKYRLRGRSSETAKAHRG